MPSVSTWIRAFRLRTLPLALSSILMGTLLAVGHGYFNTTVFILGLTTTFLLQILSNLANDYGDATSGVDGADRGGPQRTVHSGLISKKEMKSMLYWFVFLSLLSGVLLIRVSLGNDWITGLVFLFLGIAAIAAAIKYTVGSNPYGYVGWGDFFVLLFFGFVGVLGSYFLLVGDMEPLILLPALSTGLFAVAVLNVNNIRDIESDRKNGKNSIPVRVGRKRAVVYHWGLLLIGVLSSILYVGLTGHGVTGWLFLAVTPMLWMNARAVYFKIRPAELDPYLRQMAITTLLYVLLFGIGQVQF